MIDMDQIVGLVAALAAKRNSADEIPIEDVTGLQAALAAITPNLAKAAIEGMYISNTVGFTATRVSISAGQCRDRENTRDIVLPAGISKALNAQWQAGDGAGGRDTATAVVANSDYHVFVISNPTTGDVDALFSQSVVNPVLPPGFTKARRVGAVLTDGAGQVWQFRQKPNRYIEKLPRGTEYAGYTGGTSAGVLLNFHLPRGLKVLPTIYFSVVNTAAVSISGLYDPDDGLPPTFGVSTQWGQLRKTSDSPYLTINVSDVWTDSNARLYFASSASGDVAVIGTRGWLDPVEWGF